MVQLSEEDKKILLQSAKTLIKVHKKFVKAYELLSNQSDLDDDLGDAMGEISNALPAVKAVIKLQKVIKRYGN